MCINAEKKKEKEVYKYVPDSIEPVMPKIKYVNRDVKCEHTTKNE